MEAEYQQHQSLSVSSEDIEAVLKRSSGQVQRDCADHRQRLDRTYHASKVTIDRVEGLKERRTQLQQKQATVSALMAACGLPRNCWAGPVDDMFLEWGSARLPMQRFGGPLSTQGMLRGGGQKQGLAWCHRRY
ncbi:MAG: uncharacterized protein KVP18_000206 [Porospora cf. gigantea A]|uniref:uncharacterized protein n=1 Tax=Porospora cf. gigantea A TaxID=2853593 RepID=UPI00355A3488|nr:MAG: hypothetical protein KVP18_000206 [Porospora cf. gigantea A]